MRPPAAPRVNSKPKPAVTQAQPRTSIAARQFQHPELIPEPGYATQNVPVAKPMPKQVGKSAAKPKVKKQKVVKGKVASPGQPIIVPGGGQKATKKRGKKSKALPATVALTAVPQPVLTEPISQTTNKPGGKQATAVAMATVATVTDLGPHIAKANRLKLAGRVRKAALRVAIGAGSVAAIWLVGFSQYLALDANQIKVTAEPDTLVDLDAVSELVLASAGKPLARISTAQLTQALEQLPALKQAQIGRAWPNGLNVEIVSRVPAGAVVTDNGYSWVDATGIAIGDFGDNNGLAKLEGPLDKPEVLAEMLGLWQGLPPEFQDKVRVVSASAPDSISTTLHSGKYIYWGSTEQLMLKIATAQALLVRAPNSAAFDVSSPGLPVTR